MEKRVHGRVLWYNEVQGYGFLSQSEGENIFVHRSALTPDSVETLAPGQKVEYRIELSPRGIQAADVIQLN